MTERKPKRQSEPAAVTISDSDLGTEHAEKLIRPLLADRDGEVHVTLGETEVSDEHVDALFGSLMQSAMAAGGRRLAAEWKERLYVIGGADDRAQRAMANTINLDLRFGMLSPPLAAQAGCRPEVLEHQQRDADCIARLAVRGIATDGEVHKMRRRLVKQIVKAVIGDTQPQTVGVNRKTSKTPAPLETGNDRPMGRSRNARALPGADAEERTRPSEARRQRRDRP